MAEMEDKFQEILGNEEAMSQIMSLAQSFSSPSEVSSSEAPPLGEDFLGSLDPKVVSLGMKLMSAYQSSHRSIQLMTALRPFVKEERQQMMSRLTTASKIAQVVSCVFDMMGEKEDDHV